MLLTEGVECLLEVLLGLAGRRLGSALALVHWSAASLVGRSASVLVAAESALGLEPEPGLALVLALEIEPAFGRFASFVVAFAATAVVAVAW